MPSRSSHAACLVMVAAVACLGPMAGCASLKAPRWPWTKEIDKQISEDPPSEVLSSEYQNNDYGFDYLKADNVKTRWKKMVGRGPNEKVARAAMDEADALFKAGDYKAAMSKYKAVIDRWPDSSLEEDALWLLAECRFFTDQYAKAEDAYDDLVKKYANTKYLDRVAQRQFVIAKYWLELDDKHHYVTLVPNLFDRSRPLFDTRGRALKAFEHVRLNDPRGSLADDSIMAQANAHFLERQWIDADYFYGLLRTEYPDSDFLLQAHLLGLQAKLQAYQGPSYEGSVLDEASILADQVVVQFPDQLSREEEERVTRTRNAIATELADRHWRRAEFYAKGKHYTSARIYYALVARDYPETQLAEKARAKYQAIADLEDVSDNPFPMLARILNPDSLKEAELDAMAEAEPQTAIASEPESDAAPSRF